MSAGNFWIAVRKFEKIGNGHVIKYLVDCLLSRQLLFKGELSHGGNINGQSGVSPSKLLLSELYFIHMFPGNIVFRRFVVSIFFIAKKDLLEVFHAFLSLIGGFKRETQLMETAYRYMPLLDLRKECYHQLSTHLSVFRSEGCGFPRKGVLVGGSN